ncbi:sigma-70 family RNA polymerase sigma factor [Parafrankia sp. FMc2]|uniref:sigma-70 family RNA polymerase sigma factor n=1 Tax=Parafrankia sp. FMc2 TaxID=3233196 RepID=UPI0034D549B4
MANPSAGDAHAGRASGPAATGAPDRPDRPDGPNAAHALRVLFDENAADLLRYLRRISPDDPGRAEDLLQETFLRAWRHRDGLAAHASARAWLFLVARNLTVDWHRRQAARPQELPVPTVEPARAADRRAADSLDAALLRTDLVRALRALSRPHREALVHLHCLDRTQRETAAALEIPLGTVKSRHHTAVQELRRVLATRGIHGR